LNTESNAQTRGTTLMPGHQATRNAWYVRLSRRRRSSRCSLSQEEFTFRERAISA
jgi:hypothetical protein